MAKSAKNKNPLTKSDRRSEADSAVENLQAMVAERVRKARERKGIPRRVLSENSGVSQRYLAQLESGEGNISIGLLQRIATVLDHRIEWLVGVDDPWNSEVLRVAELFRNADQKAKDAALAALSPQNAKNSRGNRICLIGLRGAGKSTLGGLAAKSLGVPFLELNKEIEDIGGMPVAEIMALYGQEGYRQLELEALDRVASKPDAVILAAAGGVVADPEAFNKLLSNFNTIWLKASPQEHMARVRAQGDERPMAGNPKAMDQLVSILTSREALYAKAQAELNTSGAPERASLQGLLKLIEENRFLTD
jgi:XRE family transcriptional regulator, aerobic/anaerobic benzoate catabolism transcriptional regulator